MCVGKTLNMDSCSKFWGNLEGIWGNPGEIPYIGWKIPRVYRVNVNYMDFAILSTIIMFMNNTARKVIDQICYQMT